MIRDLQLGSASFSVAVTPRFAFDGPLTSSLVDEAGADDIEFFFAPNEGEQPKALARIASGGEMARVMLALKTTLASADTIPTYVFDEVDVGRPHARERHGPAYRAIGFAVHEPAVAGNRRGQAP